MSPARRKGVAEYRGFIGKKVQGIKVLAISLRWSGKQDHPYFKFQCPFCSAQFSAWLDSVQHRKIRSCGCLRTFSGLTRKHGLIDTPEYGAWKNIIGRCENRRHKQYEGYGGRGICICTRWRKDFAAFYSDLGPRPTAEHSIDRYPDNDGGYTCGQCEECLANGWMFNCRWATRKEQSANRGRIANFTTEQLQAELKRRKGRKV